ncbi:MAG: xanthine dehydrogenase FAD-binding subunit XdhB [Deltaproteobacteria bacterium]|nr:xanthine dehydrogenase FAD-binding subunit XdhB [Deltaproteobacteria bacterium]
MFEIDSYHKADTVANAIELLSRNPKAIPLAGGTDVLVRLHQGHPDYRHVVDIHDVAELKEITQTVNGAIRVGSGATFAQIMDNDIVKNHIPVLAQGAASVGGPQIRNMATVGGNICNGAPSADCAAPLLVLNATVVLQNPQGERRLPLHEFYQGPGLVDRRRAEIMTTLHVGLDDYRCWSGSYSKYAMRNAMDIATIGCAAACKLEDERVADIRLAFTVAGPTPLRCWKTEAKVRGAVADPAFIEQIKTAVLSDLRPRDSWRAPKDFRRHIIQTLAQRVVTSTLETCGVTL